MSNKGDLTQVTIDAGISHTQREVMIVSTDSSAHEFVRNYAQDNGYSIKEVPFGAEESPTQKKECILDAEQTGVTSSDFFKVFNGRTIGKVKVRILDEETNKAIVAYADVITQDTKTKEYEITGFMQPTRDIIEDCMHSMFREIQTRTKTDTDGGFADLHIDNDWWEGTKDTLQKYIRTARNLGHYDDC